METKTFRAKNMSDALRQTRKALGPDALILSARNLDAPNGTVEVTAVGQRPPISSAIAPKLASGSAYAPKTKGTNAEPKLQPWEKSIEPMREELSSLRRMMKEMRALTDEAILPGFNDLRNLILESSREQEASRILGPLYSDLVDCGIMSDIARDMVRTIELELGCQDLDRRDWMTLARGLLKELLSKQIEVAGPLVPGAGARVFSFVGPSGVGKTTTLAKLASRMVLSEGLDVVIITTDTYRIGSVEQARRYAELIGLPFVVADRPETLMAAMRTYSNADAILVDTPGRAFEDSNVRNELLDLLTAVGEPIETHLLTSATYSAQQSAIAARFSEFDPSRLIITKIDEMMQGGELFNTIKLTQLPLSYLTSGQRVPEDIEVAKGSRVVQFVLGGSN